MVWKKVCEAVREGRDRRLAPRIGHADALEGVPLERIADGEVEPVCGLVVVLRERLLGLSQVGGSAGGGLVVLGGVEVLLVVVNLEADLDRAVLDVGLREAEGERDG